MHFINPIANKTSEKYFYYYFLSSLHEVVHVLSLKRQNASGDCDHVIMCHYNTILLRQLGKNLFYFV